MFEVCACHWPFRMPLTTHVQDFLQYTNHVGLCTEEISAAGEAYVHTSLHYMCRPGSPIVY